MQYLDVLQSFSPLSLEVTGAGSEWHETHEMVYSTSGQCVHFRCLERCLEMTTVLTPVWWVHVETGENAGWCKATVAAADFLEWCTSKEDAREGGGRMLQLCLHVQRTVRNTHWSQSTDSQSWVIWSWADILESVTRSLKMHLAMNVYKTSLLPEYKCKMLAAQGRSSLTGSYCRWPRPVGVPHPL